MYPNGISLKSSSRTKWHCGEALAPTKRCSRQQPGRSPWASQSMQCKVFSGNMSRDRRTPRTIAKSCGDWLRPCRQLPKPKTQPNGRWWQQWSRLRWRGYKSGKWRVSKSEDLMEYEARSRSGTKRSTTGRTLEEWDPRRSAGCGFYIGGQSAKWDAARTTPSSVGHNSWKESWRSCSQGQSGRMSAGTDGTDSAQRRCTRREPRCQASNHGGDGDQPKRHGDTLNVRKKALLELLAKSPKSHQQGHVCQEVFKTGSPQYMADRIVPQRRSQRQRR